MNQQTFCPECREDVSYSVTETDLHSTLKGEAYTYPGKVAHCDRCGTEIYVGWVNDENLTALYEVYRTNHDLISLSKIREIPQKYRIGKRPLFLLLGWGELTFTRYFDGDMPTKQYSDVLKRIDEDPQYYLAVLEQNRENLKSQATYNQSKRAVEALIQPSTNSKTYGIIHYLIEKCEDITPLMLQKTLYYIQGFYYAFHHTFLLPEDCEAWVHGPVYRDIYNRFKNYQYNPIDPSGVSEPHDFTTSEQAVIDSVIQSFCCYSGKILERFTHDEAPWQEARGILPAGAPTDRIISKESIGQYFVAVKEKYSMLVPADIKSYARDKFANLS